MSDPHGQTEVLTREELDALLASLAEEREAAGGREAAAPFRILPGAGDESALRPPLVLERALQDFAAEQTRHYSNVYQTRIEFALVAWQRSLAGPIAETLLDSDRVAVIAFPGSEARGFVWLGRPLLFALLSLVFGARPGSSRTPCPRRPYTEIERRIYRRFAEEVVAQLERSWADLIDTRGRVVGIEAVEVLRGRSEEALLLATLDVCGLGDICRMRLGLPEELFAELRRATPAPCAGAEPSVEQEVREMPLEIRVELGSVAMSLAELSRLRPGSVIPIDTAEDGSLLVRVGGRPKFRGIRGTVGRRLAVQLTERFPLGEVGDGGRG